MFIFEIWLFSWYFPQFCKSDMSKYGYLEVFQTCPFDFEITRVNCSMFWLKFFYVCRKALSGKQSCFVDRSSYFCFCCHIYMPIRWLFPFKNSPKNLDPSYKMDLDFWDCFGRENPHLNSPMTQDWYRHFRSF